jgi:hypothetical protein
MREQYWPSPTPPVRGYMGFILGHPFWISSCHIYSIKVGTNWRDMAYIRAPIGGIRLISGHQLEGYDRLYQGINLRDM